ncbi:MAG: ABC transporter ATP-binding protein [Elusimicrobia bacterium]|nr:ABC transporter ATP-binding protein [Elusimicrobiota bacterium]
MSEAAPLLELQGAAKTHRLDGREIAALSPVSLQVARGEFLAVVGPSGSGKSTLLSLLGCLERPSSGRLLILGRDVSRLDDDQLSSLRARAIGFVFQSFSLLPSRDALDNVLLGALYSGLPAPERRAASLLTSLGLGHRLGHKPSMLSGGERQRVAIARALMNGPELLLADEPTGSLDPAAGDAILAILRELNRLGHTLVVVTHDPRVAARADRVIEMAGGRLARERTGRALP